MATKSKPSKGKPKKGMGYLVALTVLAITWPALANRSEAATVWAVESIQPRLMTGYALSNGFHDPGESAQFGFTPFALVLKDETGRIVELGIPTIGLSSATGSDSTTNDGSRFSASIGACFYEFICPTYGRSWQDGDKWMPFLYVDGQAAAVKLKGWMGIAWGMTGL